MPLYHNASPAGPPGSFDVVIYLDIVADSDCNINNVEENILAELATPWMGIAQAHNWNLTIALKSNLTPNPAVIWTPGTIPAGLNFVSVNAPPGGVTFFRLVVGRGANAAAVTRSGRVSYADYNTGQGYVYELINFPPTCVPDITHELGHILGLSERYYNAVYYLNNVGINRSPVQINQGEFVVPPGTPNGVDFRNGVPNTGQLMPRLAERVSLPMSMVMIPGETAFSGINPTGYDPYNNLMSNGSPTLSAFQANMIVTLCPENSYRQENWVAVLGDWRRGGAPPSQPPYRGPPGNGCRNFRNDYPATTPTTTYKWIYPAWEASAQDGGQGLMFAPITSNGTPMASERYACLSASRRGRWPNGDVVTPEYIREAKGKTRDFKLVPALVNLISNQSIHPNWFCYSRRLLNDVVNL